MPFASRSPARSLETFFWVLFLCIASGGLYGFTGTAAQRALWLMTDVFAMLIVASWPHYYLDAAAKQALLFAWPAFAVFSAVWSLTPFLSIYHGAQLAMTMLAGLALVTRFELTGVMKLLFTALAIAALASLAVNLAGLPLAFGPFGEWKGTFAHKNQLGSVMVLLFYTALLLFLRGWLRPLTGTFLLVSVGLMLLSRSTTSLLCLIGLMVVLPYFVTYRIGPAAFRTSTALVLAFVLLAGAIVASANASLTQTVLVALGKDETLTGRTTLWDFGIAAFRDAPIIGLGYKAYWDSPTTSAGYLNYFIRYELWFFHNNFLEVGVSLGSIGLTLFTAGLISVAVRTFDQFRTAKSWESAWAALFVAHIGVMLFVENPLYLNHSLPQVLFVAVAAGVTNLRAANQRRMPADAMLISARPIGNT